LTLPRGLGPVRLLIIFTILVSLLLFRSYYLPSPNAESEYDLALSGGSWGDVEDSSASNFDLKNDTEDMPHEFEPSSVISEGVEDVEDEEESKSSSEVIKDKPTKGEHLPEATSSNIYHSASFSDARPNYHSAPEEPKSQSKPIHAYEANAPACRHLPGADKVVIIVKTGASEVFTRVPEQLITLAECAPNFMIFSDMDQQIGEFHIQDALDEIGKEYKENHEDFQFYTALHAAHNSHGDVSVLGSDKAWALDKWKNIPMLHKAYTKYPDAEWFMTIDADTYLSWSNLLLLLDQMDPDDPLYAGCVYWHGPTMFAQGGTGYLLSRNAVQKWEKIRTPEKIADWEKETSGICCGDVMLGVSMGHADVPVSGAWPMFQVDPPSAFTFAESVWCSPAITWHHVHSYEVEALWQFEQAWLNKTWDVADPGSVPYTFGDVFNDFVLPHVTEMKQDWNNLSGDIVITEPKEDHVKENDDWDWKNDEEKQKMWDDATEVQKSGVESAEKCRKACQSNESCIQFSWHPGTCKFAKDIKMGRPSDSKEQYASGWMVDRVKKFVEDRGKCKEISWQVG
jgi:hypothetical protein